MHVNPYQTPVPVRRVEIVRGRCFRGLSLGGWKDEFTFFVFPSRDLPDEVTQFYLAQGARLVRHSSPLTFVRGRSIWNALGLVHERLLRQRISVSFDLSQSMTKVTVRYRVFVSLAFRTRPFQLKAEAESLASQLAAVADPSI